MINRLLILNSKLKKNSLRISAGKLLKKLEGHYLFSTCENLIASDGSIFNFIKSNCGKKLQELPKISSSTQQLVKFMKYHW